MKILVISANTERTEIRPLPLGPACVAAACSAAGHEALLLNLMFEDDPESAVRDHIAAFRPSAIGISVRNIDDQNMASPRFLLPPVRRIVSLCRELSAVPIVVGGAGYSIFPERALAYLGADLGIRGPGEIAFPALLDCLARGADPSGLPGICLPGRPSPAAVFPASMHASPLPEPESWIPPTA